MTHNAVEGHMLAELLLHSSEQTPSMRNMQQNTKPNIRQDKWLSQRSMCCDTCIRPARHVGAELKCHGADLCWLSSLQWCCQPKTTACFWEMLGHMHDPISVQAYALP